MQDTRTADGNLSLGTLLGRKQAFGLIAARCSAADIECLLEIRETRRYREVEDNWDGFCVNHLGISRATADRLIRQYTQLGPDYFKLNNFKRISPVEYRRIAEAISDEGLAFKGEVIPLDPGHAAQLASAVEELRRETAPQPPTEDSPEQAFAKAEKSVQTALVEFQRLQAMTLDDDNRLRLAVAVESARDEWIRLCLTVVL